MTVDSVQSRALMSLVRFPDLYDEAGLSAEFFSEPTLAKLWRAIPAIPRAYRTSTGAIPMLAVAEKAGIDTETISRLAPFVPFDREQARDAIACLHARIDLENLKSEIATLLATPQLAAEEFSASLIEVSRKYSGAGASRVRTLAELEEQAFDEYSRQAEKGASRRVLTGVPSLDRRIRGLRPGELTTIFSGPGIGKSTFAVQVARKAAEQDGHVLFVSGEMTTEQVGERGLFSSAGVHLGEERPNLFALKTGLDNIRRKAVDQNIHVDGRFRTKPEQVIAEVRRLQSTGKAVGLVIYDHLRHMEVKGARSDWEKLSIAIAAAKEIAKAIPVHVLMLTHRNRTDGKPSDRPTLDGIKGSGNIGDDSDNVLALWRDVAKPGPDTELLVLKARQTGMTGTIHLSYDACWQFYAEAT